MQGNSIYTTEIYVGHCKISQPLQKKIKLIFRIGKNVVQNISQRKFQSGIPFNTKLYLNIDKTALGMQRSSLTLQTVNQKQNKTLGIALINVPHKGNISHNKKYKLVNCTDKNAQIDVSITIKPFDQTETDLKKSHLYQQNIPQIGHVNPQTSQPFSTRSPSNSSMKGLAQFKKPLKGQNTSQQKNIISKLQRQCDCLKALLKIQIKKNEQSQEMIKQLSEHLQQPLQKKKHSEIAVDLLDETLLLQQDKQLELDQLNRMNYRLKGKVVQLQMKIKQLNFKLNNKIRQHQNYPFRAKVDHYYQFNGDSHINIRQLLSKNNNLQLINLEAEYKYTDLQYNLKLLQDDIMISQAQFQQKKKNIKLAFDKSPFSSKSISNQQNVSTSFERVRKLVEKMIIDRNKMFQMIARYYSHMKNNKTLDILLTKIKQKIEKSFGSMSMMKRINRQILSMEKTELLKVIEELYNNFDFNISNF